MPASQFSTARREPDGRIHVSGGQVVSPEASAPEVEYRFLLVQGDTVVKGTGKGEGSGWQGQTDQPQSSLEPGPVLAIGLAIQARTDTTGPGYETLTWSEQIELQG
jgi:hypothetical protein